MQRSNRVCFSSRALRLPPLFRLVSLGLLLWGMATPRLASAAERIALWGIFDGCERVPELDRVLLRHLQDRGLDAMALEAPASACSGPTCAQRVQAACGSRATAGFLLGGQVFRTKSALRLRLWLHDLSAGRSAYLDEYCQDCLLPDLLIAATDKLRAAPRFAEEASAAPPPAYCAPSTPRPTADPRRAKLVLLVYGEAKSRAPLVAALRDGLADTLRPLQVAAADRHRYESPDFANLLGASHQGQLVAVELGRDGGAQLYLFDGPTGRVAQSEIKCRDCRPEDLIERSKLAVQDLLRHCFDTLCAQSYSRPSNGADDVCEPMTPPQCQEVPLPPVAAATPAGPKNPPASHVIDPGVRKVIYGGLWGLVAASSVTAIGLLAANASSAGRISTADYDARGTLGGAALTATAFSVAALAVAIPTTLVVRRASRNSAGPDDSPGGARCPN